MLTNNNKKRILSQKWDRDAAPGHLELLPEMPSSLWLDPASRNGSPFVPLFGSFSHQTLIFQAVQIIEAVSVLFWSPK